MGRIDTLRNFGLSLLIAVAFFAKAQAVKAAETETLTVAGGCFWCVESDFESVKGVVDVVSGYTGGKTENPTYKQIGKGDTGHFEAVQIIFDPAVIGRADLLHMFLRSIDPTDSGGQFCDRGAPYRTAIFVSNKAETTVAKQILAQAERDLGAEIVTPVLAAAPFYKAEDYHQNYYKGDSLVFTRFGPLRQSKAYKRYREACGRDARVRELWGDKAPFALTH